MDTTSFKSFATSARTELIREVGARITAVLAQGSPERVEQPRAVTALERAISTGGGGANGKAHVADKVAYTWFNRLIALRFMDANSYTDVGVVSPAADQVGQPEVLAAAKRGQIDSDVVSSPNVATVTGLLNGARQPRPGIDAQAEAYEILLADYCRFWNRAMPFMFEREGDFTELLLPANLLAEDSVLNRAVKILTEEACQDVEVIGWLYQFYISERKQEVFDGFNAKGNARKYAGADEIPAATQLFTPHWIVRYLVENSLGRLWMLNHPESRLVDQMDYYIDPVDENADFLKITKPENLTLIDPACGSGHMLTYAFDLLYAIYEEEGYTPSQIPGLILTNNLYGTEIDQRAGALAAFALTMKAAAKRRLFLKNPVEPKICVLDPISFTADELSYLVTEGGDCHEEEAFWNQFAEADTLGALIQPDPDLTAQLTRQLESFEDGGEIFRADTLDRAQRVVTQAEYLLSHYTVVVANPPYMQSDNMNDTLRQFAQSHFPGSKADLFAMFIERNRSLAVNNGIVAMITMNSWMYLKSFEALRRTTLFKGQLITLADLGTGAFPTIPGQVVSAAAFVLTNVRNPTGSAVFVDATSVDTSRGKERLLLDAAGDVAAPERTTLEPNVFSAIPGALVLISVNADMLRQFSEWSKVGTRFEPRAGISTGRNGEFIRLWFEVAQSAVATKTKPDGRWKLHNKGGGGERRWYGNVDYVLRYDPTAVRRMEALPGFRHDGKDRYFQPHVGWSKVSTKSPAFRFYPEGMTFDSGGLGIFATDEQDLFRVLLYLNSRLARTLIEAVSPTLNLSPGQLSALPLAPLDSVNVDGVKRVVDGAQRLWEWNEEAWGFERPRVLDESGTLSARVQDACQVEIDLDNDIARRIGQLATDAGWGVEEDANLPSLIPQRSTSSVVADLVSYAVGCMFGRYSVDKPGLVLADQGATLQDYLAKVPLPTILPDANNVIPIMDGPWFEDTIDERFRQFLRVAFGEQHFAENLQFVTDSLGVKHLREYFVKSFYKDHVKRYRNRPIYWLFSSPKGSFNALIYMHRYTPSTVSTVLTYLREYVTKLESSVQQAERVGNAKESDRLRKILVELSEYEHDTLFPKASENVVIDLDDGVKVNYPKFGAALKKIPGLEATND